MRALKAPPGPDYIGPDIEGLETCRPIANSQSDTSRCGCSCKAQKEWRASRVMYVAQLAHHYTCHVFP
jgi:hypothetical protein